MRRLAVLVATLVLTTGFMFPQGWHWPRTGSDTRQTWVYVENHVAGYQGPYLAWVANVYTQHPELAIRLVADCGTRKNCIYTSTRPTPYPYSATTWLAAGTSPHMATGIRFDPSVGRDTGHLTTLRIFFHEFCHALGGGFGGEAIHRGCDSVHKAAIWQAVKAVYHNDPG